MKTIEVSDEVYIRIEDMVNRTKQSLGEIIDEMSYNHQAVVDEWKENEATSIS